MKITAKKIRPYIKIVLLLALGAAMVYVFLFLENYFYPAITGTQAISVLQKNMALNSINLKQFERLVKNINEKTASFTSATVIINPFK